MRRPSNFSNTEWLGIALMVAGLGIGFYSSISYIQIMQSSLDKFSNTIATNTDLNEIKSATSAVSTNLGGAFTTLGYSGTGFWTFMTGLAAFTVARRFRWNQMIRDEAASDEAA